MAAMQEGRGERALVITQGDPEGVGPELLLRAAAEGRLRAGDLVFADHEHLRRIAPTLPPWGRRGLDRITPLIAPASAWRTPDVGATPQARRASRGQVAALASGVDAVLTRRGASLVTAPIDKARAGVEGLGFPGHTEYLAARADVRDYAMAMVGPRLRVVLATIHEPLAAVPELLDVERIVRAGRLLGHALREVLGIARPHIAVLGLNPHAGEGGLLGREDEAVIRPAVGQLAAWGRPREVTFEGPLPADTALPRHFEGHYDGVVAMYHDQGLTPFKLVHFHDGVNWTLGLPFVRTSPDHGTARDIAGQGIADPRSFFSAVALARDPGRAWGPMPKREP